MSATSSKSMLAAPLIAFHRGIARLHRGWNRVHSFAKLSASLSLPLPASTVVLGPASVYGTGRIRCGRDLLIYPFQYFETEGDAEISIGDGVVLSSGVHLVAYAGIEIGEGTMIGEYSSIRDANHTREAGKTLRDSDHVAKPIAIGKQVWIGRGVAILSGVSIGDGATVGANAVVTRDVPAGVTVAGVPARPIGVKSSAVPLPATSPNSHSEHQCLIIEEDLRHSPARDQS